MTTLQKYTSKVDTKNYDHLFKNGVGKTMHLYVLGINLGLKNRSTNSGVFWSKNGRAAATFGTTFDTCNGDRAGSEPKGSLMVPKSTST